MLPENKQNEQKFDLMLKKTLKKHQELPRREFSEKLIAEIRTLEQQNALRKVIWQERLLLTGVILFPIAAIVLLFIYPVVISEPVRLFAKLTPQSIETGIGSIFKHWQLWLCYAIAAASAIYAAYEILPRDN
jgi:hypothetical protein